MSVPPHSARAVVRAERGDLVEQGPLRVCEFDGAGIPGTQWRMTTARCELGVRTASESPTEVPK